MLNSFDILETIKMIEDEHLDIRTITMGISLLDCITGDINTTCDKVYDKITRKAASKSRQNWVSRSSTSAFPSHRWQ